MAAELFVAELTGRLLRRAGYSVLVASSAQQALEPAATPPTIDLVLSDVVMPEMDGVQLAERLRGRKRRAKALPSR